MGDSEYQALLDEQRAAQRAESQAQQERGEAAQREALRRLAEGTRS